MLVINDSTPNDVLFPTDKGRGYVERDFSVHPKTMFSPPSDIKLIPRSEWDARINEQEELQSSLEHLRLSGNSGKIVPSLDQGPVGYCWAHSTTHVSMLARMVMNQPYVPLSAYAIAATIKKGADEGGWCGLSAEFIRNRGVPSQALWPQGDRNYKQHDKPDVWANAALHKSTEDYVDLSKEVYDQNLSFDMVATCLLLNIPCALDFNWWSHSVCGLRLMRVESGSYGIKIWNSWGDQWEDRGMAVLQGQKAIPDGAIAIRVSTASAA